MADLGTRVQDYMGTFADSAALDDWLTAGARLHLRIMPPNELDKFTTETSVTTGGLDVSDKIVTSVDKAGHPSIGYPAKFKARLEDSDSIYLATTKSPAHVIKGGSIYVFPGGGNADVITMPSVSNTDSDIAVLPDDLVDATVLYACLQALQKRVQDEITSISTSGITIASTPTYSAASKHSDIEGDYDTADTALSDDDFEKSGSTLNKVGTQLREYAADIEEAVSQYNADITKWAQDQRISSENEQLKLSQFVKKIESISGQIQMLSQQYQNTISPYIRRQ